jgi:hypothetical protein
MNARLAIALVAFSLAAAPGATSPAQAKGCIRGAIAGGVAGHMVHHTWTGAAAGCLAARHYYKQKERQTQQPAPARESPLEHPAGY